MGKMMGRVNRRFFDAQLEGKQKLFLFIIRYYSPQINGNCHE